MTAQAQRDEQVDSVAQRLGGKPRRTAAEAGRGHEGSALAQSHGRCSFPSRLAGEVVSWEDNCAVCMEE